MQYLKRSKLYAGNLNNLKDLINNKFIRTENFNEISNIFKKLSLEAKTPIFLAKDNEILAILAICDPIKEDSKMTIKLLKEKISNFLF